MTTEERYELLTSHLIFNIPYTKDNRTIYLRAFDRAVSIYPVKNKIHIEPCFIYSAKEDIFTTEQIVIKAKTYNKAIKKLYKYVIKRFGKRYIEDNYIINRKSKTILDFDVVYSKDIETFHKENNWTY